MPLADSTVTGEGVVLAQRLEQLAGEGGVCIQGAAYETVPKRLPFSYRSLGEHQAKGFDEPVRVYAVSLNSGAAIPKPEAQVFPAPVSMPGLHDKPSIAVLPFTNLSADREQEYFSDGITEEIINAVVKIPGISVPARTSVFGYKGYQGDIREVGLDLGVAYLLEGSVRSQGDQVRVWVADRLGTGQQWAANGGQRCPAQCGS